MTLEEVRACIDEIDEQLLPLFTARMDCAVQVAKIKKEQGLPVLNTGREKEILDRMSARAGDYSNETRMLYAALMDMSRARQHAILGGGQAFRDLVENAAASPIQTRRPACFGNPGSYCHQAVQRLYPGSDPLFFPRFAEIFQAVDTGKAELGVLPVENSSAGSVGEVYDLILKYRFYIVAAETLEVRHCLAAAPLDGGAPLRMVLSHPQALAQCSWYLSAHSYETRECASTTAAAEEAAKGKDPGVAAICSEEAARAYGLRILARGIQNIADNCTRFISISRRACIPQDANKISLCFSLPHETGSLYNVLSRFATAGLNLTKIESRPIPGKRFEYDFYLDFTGNVRDLETQNLLAALYDELPRFSFLGNYREED